MGLYAEVNKNVETKARITGLLYVLARLKVISSKHYYQLDKAMNAPWVSSYIRD